MGRGFPDARSASGVVVSTCGLYVSGFACVSVRQCFAEASENRHGTGSLGDMVTSEWIGKMRREAGETKVTNVRVYWRGSPARLRAGDRKRGSRGRAARRGEPDAEGASSTTRGPGRWRRTPRWSYLAA